MNRRSALEIMLKMLYTVKGAEEEALMKNEDFDGVSRWYIVRNTLIGYDTFAKYEEKIKRLGLLKEEKGKYLLSDEAKDILGYHEKLEYLNAKKVSIFSEKPKEHPLLSIISEPEEDLPMISIIKEDREQEPEVNIRKKRNRKRLKAEYIYWVTKARDEALEKGEEFSGTGIWYVQRHMITNSRTFTEVSMDVIRDGLVKVREGKLFPSREGMTYLAKNPDSEVRAFFKVIKSSEGS